jgi:PAS domain S-box-containing protein
MYEATVSFLLGFSACAIYAMGGAVLYRNPQGRTHRAFALLGANLGLWSLGVLAILHSHTDANVTFWVRATFVVAAFIPANFHYFMGIFPRQRFEGNRIVMSALCVGAFVLIGLSFTRWYLKDVQAYPEAWPKVYYGPAFMVYPVCTAAAMIFGYRTLLQKRRRAAGIERRQIEHVLLGIFLFATMASITNVVGPHLGFRDAEAYGPVFLILMAAVFGYAMVRYHLMDIWVIISRTSVYASVTAVVALVFLGTVWGVQWAFQNQDSSLPPLLAACVVVLILQPLKERLELFADRALVKRKYDSHALLSRASQHAMQITHLDELLRTVTTDIRESVGMRFVRVLLVDEKDPASLITEYSTDEGEVGFRSRSHAPLVEYIRANPEPILLEQWIHQRTTPERARIAAYLAELDAYLCLPLQTTSGLVGLMTLDQKVSRDIYTADDVVVFTAMATPLAKAIENARLYRGIEEANALRAQVLNNMRGGVLAVDTGGKITTVNHGARDIIGPVDVGQHIDTLMPEVANVLQKTLRDHTAISDYECTIERDDGAALAVVISSSCLETAGHEFSGAMAMVYDLTRIKALEQNAQRADRLSSIGTLAAGMAHEIKNPLVSIKTFSQLLPKQYDDPEFRDTFTDIVPHEVERINSIVKRLLDFASPKPSSYHGQDLCAIIREVLTLVRNQVEHEEVTVATSYAKSRMRVYGDEQQLHQVFLNLFLNALDALRQTDGGLLSIKVEFGRMRSLDEGIDPLHEVECAVVTVSDTGDGIEPEMVQRIFTPFFTTKEEGCGLGLAVVHGIITEHGGEIEVHSSKGEGTQFVISLPLAREEGPEDTATP